MELVNRTAAKGPKPKQPSSFKLSIPVETPIASSLISMPTFRTFGNAIRIDCLIFFLSLVPFWQRAVPSLLSERTRLKFAPLFWDIVRPQVSHCSQYPGFCFHRLLRYLRKSCSQDSDGLRAEVALSNTFLSFRCDAMPLAELLAEGCDGQVQAKGPTAKVMQRSREERTPKWTRQFADVAAKLGQAGQTLSAWEDYQTGWDSILRSF